MARVKATVAQVVFDVAVCSRVVRVLRVVHPVSMYNSACSFGSRVWGTVGCMRCDRGRECTVQGRHCVLRFASCFELERLRVGLFMVQ